MSKKLVAYFSASNGGVTRAVAKRLAAATGADLFEIEPEVAYTQADLDWTNRKSRSTVEMEDKSFRPAIKGVPTDLAQYDEVFIGFPIWWYVAPTIVNTFLEAGDFAGKKIALFATSGSSQMGKSMDELKPSAPAAEWVGQKRFPANATENDLKAWADSLGM